MNAWLGPLHHDVRVIFGKLRVHIHSPPTKRHCVGVDQDRSCNGFHSRKDRQHGPVVGNGACGEVACIKAHTFNPLPRQPCEAVFLTEIDHSLDLVSIIVLTMGGGEVDAVGHTRLVLLVQEPPLEEDITTSVIVLSVVILLLHHMSLVVPDEILIDPILSVDLGTDQETNKLVFLSKERNAVHC